MVNHKGKNDSSNFNEKSKDLLWVALVVICGFTCYEIGRLNNVSSSNPTPAFIESSSHDSVAYFTFKPSFLPSLALFLPSRNETLLTESKINNKANKNANTSKIAEIKSPPVTLTASTQNKRISRQTKFPTSAPINKFISIEDVITSCDSLATNISFKSDQDLIKGLAPPLLVSYPGSGALFVRSLVEFSTQWLSGSLGTSDDQKDGPKNEYFQGDNSCNLLHSMVTLTHPKTFRLSVSKIGYVFLNQKKHRRRCRSQAVYGFKRIILLVRNPVHTILSDFLNLHYSIMPANSEPFELKGELKQKWISFYNESSQIWYKSWDENLYPVVEHLLPGYTNMIILRYEDLMNPKSRMKTLNVLISYILGKPVSSMRLECALNLTMQRKSYIRDEIPDYILKQVYADPSSQIFRDSSFVSNLQPFVTNLSYPDALCPIPEGSTNSQLEQSNCLEARAAYSHSLSNPLSHIHELSSCAHDHGDRVFVPLKDTPAKISLSTTRMLSYGAVNSLVNAKTLTDIKAGAFDRTNSVQRALLTENKAKKSRSTIFSAPPLLLSYPGSGNTWVRLLLEFASGIYSGSIDLTDGQLQVEILGENLCSPINSVIKAHPININYSTIINGVTLIAPEQQGKCYSIPAFHRVILLVRNPYNAIMAEYQRALTKSHTGGLDVNELDDAAWNREAVLAAMHYDTTWKATVGPMTARLPKNQLKILRYEMLVDPTQRQQTLESVIHFLGHNPSIHSHIASVASKARMQCSFKLAQNPKVYREKTKKSINVTYAYRNASLVREMWNHLAQFSHFSGYQMGPVAAGYSRSIKQQI